MAVEKKSRRNGADEEIMARTTSRDRSCLPGNVIMSFFSFFLCELRIHCVFFDFL